MDEFLKEDEILFSERVDCACQILRTACYRYQKGDSMERERVIKDAEGLLVKKEIEFTAESMEEMVDLLIEHTLLLQDKQELLYPGNGLSMNFYDFLLLIEPWMVESEESEDVKELLSIPVYYILFPDMWDV